MVVVLVELVVVLVVLVVVMVVVLVLVLLFICLSFTKTDTSDLGHLATLWQLKQRHRTSKNIPL
ncbi:hypothetical protein E2C01_054128 [Portunus trituberculatus]|uniref:Uncharacterized protein n=1 Tax=Portunus trituberculatus TaxID=210409 RepID=A0A5B7GJ22_PORTR|nr:hypothetical protein [Portunus trituberculatus]